MVSGFWSAVVQLRGVTQRHDLHDLDVFPLSSETFLCLEFESLCFTQNADLASRKATIFALIVGKVSSPIFVIIFWGYPLVYSEKYSVNFHVAHVLFAGALRVCSLICFYWEGYAAVASPSGNLEVVDC